MATLPSWTQSQGHLFTKGESPLFVKRTGFIHRYIRFIDATAANGTDDTVDIDLPAGFDIEDYVLPPRQHNFTVDGDWMLSQRLLYFQSDESYSTSDYAWPEASAGYLPPAWAKPFVNRNNGTLGARSWSKIRKKIRIEGPWSGTVRMQHANPSTGFNVWYWTYNPGAGTWTTDSDTSVTLTEFEYADYYPADPSSSTELTAVVFL